MKCKDFVTFWVFFFFLLMTANSVATENPKVEGKLIVDGKEVKLSYVYSRKDEIVGKSYITVILTEKAVPENILKKDTIYQLAYSKEIQGIRIRFNDQKELAGVIVYHAAFDGPSREYQGFAKFENILSGSNTIHGKITMDDKDIGHTIRIDAVFLSQIPAN